MLVLGHTLGGLDEMVGKGSSCWVGPGSPDSPGTLGRADATHTGSLFSLSPEREGAADFLQLVFPVAQPASPARVL